MVNEETKLVIAFITEDEYCALETRNMSAYMLEHFVRDGEAPEELYELFEEILEVSFDDVDWQAVEEACQEEDEEEISYH